MRSQRDARPVRIRWASFRAEDCADPHWSSVTFSKLPAIATVITQQLQKGWL